MSKKIIKQLFADDPEISSILSSMDKTEMEGLVDSVKETAKNSSKKLKIDIGGAEMVSLQGKKGDKGEKGDMGQQGERGFKGDKGDQGQRGVSDIPGPRGIPGKDGIDGTPGKKGDQGDRGDPGTNGLDGSPDSPLTIANKLNSLSDIIEPTVIRGYQTTEDIAKEFKRGGKYQIALNDVKGAPLDMRWHGGGLNKVSHDDTLTGDGTPTSPLVVVGGGGGDLWTESMGMLYPTNLGDLVGIGTDTPTEALEVDGNIQIDSDNAIKSPDATTSSNANGHNININIGNGDGSGFGGSFQLNGGDGGDTGDGGPIVIFAGSGGATSGNGGDISFNGGDVQGTGDGGNINFTTPNVSGGAGSFNFQTGNSNVNGGGGNFTVFVGKGSNGSPGGTISLVAIGNRDDSPSSGIYIAVSDAFGTNQDGGLILLDPGHPTGTGATAFTWIKSGKVSLGSIVPPTAHLHISASDGSAKSAPIKIAPGSLMSSPEDGAIETDGTNIYWTNNLSNRWQLNFMDSSGNVHITGKLTVDGPIDPTYIDFTQISTPSNPVATHNRLYFKSDNNVYMLNSSGTETKVSGGGTGSVTSVSVVSANGLSGTVASATTTPAITLTAGALTPTSVNGLVLSTLSTGYTIAGGTVSKTLTVNNTTSLSATDGKGINIGAATSGKVLIGDGSNMVLSTPTFPNASATSGKFIRSDGTNWIASTPTLPTTVGSAGKILTSDGTNYVESTPTFPSSAGASGNVLTSDGTNWSSAAPSSGATITSIVPYSVFPTTDTDRQNFNSNTTLSVGMVNIPAKIIANKISIHIETVGTAGTLKLALFSEDGQTQLFSVTTANITGTPETVTTTLSSVTINPGNYYIALLPVSTAAITSNYYNPADDGTQLSSQVTGKAVLSGKITVTASTMPSTITPSTITAENRTLLFRLDN